MNVASLELCKELYEPSGWGLSSEQLGIHMEPNGTFNRYGAEMNDLYPAYDLGYLLRKLPTKTQIYKGVNYWTVGCDRDNVHRVKISPENAACKLAIELFKRGVLTRESA